MGHVHVLSVPGGLTLSLHFGQRSCQEFVIKNFLEGLLVLGLLAFQNQGEPPIIGGLHEIHAQMPELRLFFEVIFREGNFKLADERQCLYNDVTS